MVEGAPPRGIDVSTPNVARIYDYMLGGKDNFAADREAAEQILKAFPEARDGVRYNREFLGTAVRHLTEKAGIRQFVDIGAGLPTQRNVHEAARSITPDAHTVYVDNDPVVCVHGRAILASSPGAAMVQADLSRPKELVAAVAESGLIDWSRPVGVLMVALLHFLPDPYEEVAYLREIMAPGSHLVITHMTLTDDRAGDTDQVRGVYEKTASGLFPRAVADIVRFFGDFEQLDPAQFIDAALLRRFSSLGWGAAARKGA
ncbi:SAM-dependent methyltransferase [Sphaerimonospora cavernae]|uniref:SAM-dependent methyltransferase n=1 Tax=Sphaerimonospora cavernae TaxID=1740611 RepID=A0ABV6U2R6_9ACTN